MAKTSNSMYGIVLLILLILIATAIASAKNYAPDTFYQIKIEKVTDMKNNYH